MPQDADRKTPQAEYRKGSKLHPGDVVMLDDGSTSTITKIVPGEKMGHLVELDDDGWTHLHPTDRVPVIVNPKARTTTMAASAPSARMKQSQRADTNMPALEISGEVELLALLRAAPAVRAVTYPDNENPAVCECKNGDPAKPVKVLAWVRQEGTAWGLLDRAYEAAGDAAKSLAVVYGPYCSTWVLPEHPLAFTDGAE